jgi:hypothetical protein
MWVMTEIGFFSVVQKPNTPKGILTVRARAREDLLGLKNHIPTIEIIDHEGTDYPYRARVSRDDWIQFLETTVANLDYDNFKNRVAFRQGNDRAAVYGRIWNVLWDLYRPPGKK